MVMNISAHVILTLNYAHIFNTQQLNADFIIKCVLFFFCLTLKQESEIEEECPGSLIKLNGVSSPPATLYHGPAFPTQPKDPEPLTQPVLNIIQQRDTVENRLVDW